MDNITTTDLGDFGYRELKELNMLINALLEQGLPEGFEDGGITPMFNKRSGKVFFTNEFYQVAMLNGEKLEQFFSLPYGGDEGFKNELKELYKEDKEYFHTEDIKYLKEYNIID